MNIEIIINNENDFNKLNTISRFSNELKRVNIRITNDILFTKALKPADFKGIDVCIYGNNHILCNVNIFNVNDDKLVDNAGIFKNVKNLYVEDLKINHAYVYAGQVSGLLAANVEDSLTLMNSDFNNVIVNCEAYCGGVVGVAKTVQVSDSRVLSKVYGIDVVGGVAGMADKYIEEDSYIDGEIIAVGKAIGQKVGFCYNQIIKSL